MPLIREEDLKQIEQTLYTAKESELVSRRILRVNTNFSPFASEIGYDWFNRKGSAKILSTGASAKDVPFVSEDGGRSTQKVYDIVSGIRFSLKEIEASQFRGTQTNVPSVKLDMLRVETARRAIAETENRLVFIGNDDFGIKGLLNFVGITAENVAVGQTGANDIEKRKWINKNPQEILADIRTGRTKARNKGLFNPDTIVLPPDQLDLLDQPFSTTSTMTIKAWLNSQGINFPKVFGAKEMGKDYNGFSSVDCMLILDSSPEIAEIAVTRELQLMNPVYDLVGNSEQVAMESLAGVIVRHPSAIYVGKGI
jgi:hypothetical protein